MDRGAGWAIVHEVTESDMTEVTEQACSFALPGPAHQGVILYEL